MSKTKTINVPRPSTLAKLADDGVGKYAAARRLAAKGYTGPTGGKLYASTCERLLRSAYPDRPAWGKGKPSAAERKARKARRHEAAGPYGAIAKRRALPAPKGKQVEQPSVLVIITESDGARLAHVRPCADPAQAVAMLLCADTGHAVVLRMGEVAGHVAEQAVDRVLRTR